MAVLPWLSRSRIAAVAGLPSTSTTNRVLIAESALPFRYRRPGRFAPCHSRESTRSAPDRHSSCRTADIGLAPYHAFAPPTRGRTRTPSVRHGCAANLHRETQAGPRPDNHTEFGRTAASPTHGNTKFRGARIAHRITGIPYRSCCRYVRLLTPPEANPPSTGRVMPVMYRDSGRAR